MDNLTHWLSFGAGVNSVAYYFYMIEKGVDFEAVFADHGADGEETYRYMDYFNNELVKRGLKPVTIIEGKVQEKSMDKPLGLLQYCYLKKTMPKMMFRWCTDKFKIIPVNMYINSKLAGGENEKCYYHLGIAWDESDRAHAPEAPPAYLRNKIYQYWFVEDGLTRQDNIDLIKKHGIEVPPKSGCYFCPFQSDKEFRRIYEESTCTYEKIKLLEHSTNKRRKEAGLKPTYLRGKPIEIIVHEGQFEWDADTGETFNYDTRKPCNCGL